MNRGVLKRRKNKCIHFTAETSNVELLFRLIHSANKLSIYGGVSSWCEELGLRPNERDMSSERFKRKRTVIAECETARSKFFGANFKE